MPDIHQDFKYNERREGCDILKEKEIFTHNDCQAKVKMSPFLAFLILFDIINYYRLKSQI